MYFKSMYSINVCVSLIFNYLISIFFNLYIWPILSISKMLVVFTEFNNFIITCCKVLRISSSKPIHRNWSKYVYSGTLPNIELQVDTSRAIVISFQ